MIKIIFVLLTFCFLDTAKADGVLPETVLRPLATDRPGRTDTPYTVVPGNYQFETDIVSYTSDEDSGTRYRNLSVNNITFKAGVTQNSDLELNVPSFIQQELNAPQDDRRKRGMGDIVLRYKINLFGNDSAGLSLGMVSYIKLPTGSGGISGEVTEGGFIFPGAVQVWEKWSLGFMGQIDHGKVEGNSQTNFIMTTYLGRQIFGELSGFFEIYTKISDRPASKQQVTADFNFTYLVKENIQLDTGVYIGLTEATEDYTTYLGLSMLFR